MLLRAPKAVFKDGGQGPDTRHLVEVQAVARRGGTEEA